MLQPAWRRDGNDRAKATHRLSLQDGPGSCWKGSHLRLQWRLSPMDRIEQPRRLYRLFD